MLKILFKNLTLYLIAFIISINLMRIASGDLLKTNTNQMIGSGRIVYSKIEPIAK
jgi:hypothetical protein